MTSLDEPRPDLVAAEGREDLLAGLAGACALAAGTAHLVVTPHHLVEAPLIGVLFLLLGLGQVGLALAFRVLRATTALLAVVALHVTVIGLYVASRTVELPFLPPHDAGRAFAHLPVAGGIGSGIPVYPGSRIEEVGAIDLICLVAELGLVVAVVALLPDRTRTRVLTALIWLGGAAVAARVVLA